MTKSDQTQNTLPHDLILEGREKLSVTGVNKVLQCDAENAVLDTSKGKGATFAEPKHDHSSQPSEEQWAEAIAASEKALEAIKNA